MNRAELIARCEALEADLAETRSDRQREHELRVRYASVTETQAERIRRMEAAPDERDARIQALEALLGRCRWIIGQPRPAFIVAEIDAFLSLSAKPPTRTVNYTSSVTDSIDIEPSFAQETACEQKD
jgi:hypothetical protein